MKLFKTFALLLFATPLLCIAQAESADDELSQEFSPEEIELLREFEADSIHGVTGVIPFSAEHCKLTVPEGFVFLDTDASRHLLVDYWGNPDTTACNILGTLVSSDAGIYYNVEIAYVISYLNDGYVSDEDANEIDYDDLLNDIRDALKEENEADPSAPQWEIIGWAWEPNYDQTKKTLAWAKHYNILYNTGVSHEVLNYDVRILGREGYVIIRAVASPEAKDELLANNSAIVSGIKYDDGYRYEDFDPETDHVAEWTIGSLIAGKALAKAGLWAIIAKFGKVIVVAILALIAAMRKRIVSWFSRSKKEADMPDKDND